MRLDNMFTESSSSYLILNHGCIAGVYIKKERLVLGHFLSFLKKLIMCNMKGEVLCLIILNIKLLQPGSFECGKTSEIENLSFGKGSTKSAKYN